MNSRIQNWKNLRATMDDYKWQKKGISLYKELLKTEPRNMEYQMELLELLIETGMDEKLKCNLLGQAKSSFLDVLELEPNNQEALYRMGHICFELEEYPLSIKYFLSVIEELSDTRRVRACCALAESYHYLVDSESALSYYQKALNSDKERNFTSEIQKTKKVMTQDGDFTATITDEDGVSFATPDHLDLLEDGIITGDVEPVLFLLQHPRFVGQGDAVFLEPREAKILEYLIENSNRFVSKEELIQLFEMDAHLSDSAIRSNISKIRGKIHRCLKMEKKDMIVSKRYQGYKWNANRHVKISRDL